MQREPPVNAPLSISEELLRAYEAEARRRVQTSRAPLLVRPTRSRPPRVLP